MNSTMTLMLLALGGEILLLLFVALLVSWWRNRGARRRDAQAVRSLVEKVKKGRGEREAEIGRFLAERMGLSGGVLDEARVAMIRAELSLLQHFARVYRGRDTAAASRFDVDLHAAIQPYHALSASGAGAEADDAGPADAGELERLRRENARLSDELRITMETMSRMLNEYSTMFSADSAAGAAPLAAVAGGLAAVGAAAAQPQPDAGTGADAAEHGEEPGEVDLVGTESVSSGERDVAAAAEAAIAPPAETAARETAETGALRASALDASPSAPADVEVDLSEVADLLASVDADGEPAAAAAGPEVETMSGDPAKAPAVDAADAAEAVASMLEEGDVEVVGLDGGDDPGFDVVDPDVDDEEDLFDTLDGELAGPTGTALGNKG